MIYAELAPIPCLSRFIECYWSITSCGRQDNNPDLLVPDIFTHLIFTSDKKPFLIGSMTEVYSGLPEPDMPYQLFSIKFKPGGIYALLNINPEIITNHIIDTDIVTKFILNLYEPGMTLTFFKKQADHFFISRLNFIRYTDERILFAIDQIQKTNGVLPVQNIIRSCFLSQRQFERLFMKHIGFTAKSFSQVVRLNQMINEPAHLIKDLNMLSLKYNYHDIPHLLNDVKKITGYSLLEFIEKAKMPLFYNPE